MQGTHRTAWPELERTHLLKPHPVLLPPFSAVCISLSFSYGTLTFPFFSPRSNQLPASNKVDGELGVLQLGGYHWGLCAVPIRAQGVFIWSAWEVVGGSALCWPEWGAVLLSSHLTSGRRGWPGE